MSINPNWRKILQYNGGQMILHPECETIEEVFELMDEQARNELLLEAKVSRIETDDESNTTSADRYLRGQNCPQDKGDER